MCLAGRPPVTDERPGNQALIEDGVRTKLTQLGAGAAER